MEDTLRGFTSIIKGNSAIGLNPYSNGRYSESEEKVVISKVEARS